MTTLGNHKYDNLFAGGADIVSEAVTLKAGRTYVKGTVLGLITTEDKMTIVDSTTTDGSDKPYGILADNIDATSGDKPAVVYLTGEFNQDALIFGGTDTADTHKVALREIGIFLKENL